MSNVGRCFFRLRMASCSKFVAGLQLYVIFCVRSLEMCDGLAVSAEERRTAAERFENALVDELHQKLTAEKARIAAIQAQMADVSKHAHQAETAKRSIETRFSEENRSHMHVRCICVELFVKVRCVFGH